MTSEDAHITHNQLQYHHLPETEVVNGTTNMRHSRRQLAKQRKQLRRRSSCPTDCDGVTRWPETPAGSLAQLNCLELLKTIKQEGEQQEQFLTTPSVLEAQLPPSEGDGGEGEVDGHSDGLLKLDGAAKVLQAEGYRLSGEFLLKVVF